MGRASAQEQGGGLADGLVVAGGEPRVGVDLMLGGVEEGEVAEPRDGGDACLGADEPLADLGESGEGVEGWFEFFEAIEELLGGEVVDFAEGEEAEVAGEEVLEELVGVG